MRPLIQVILIIRLPLEVDHIVHELLIRVEVVNCLSSNWLHLRHVHQIDAANVPSISAHLAQVWLLVREDNDVWRVVHDHARLILAAEEDPVLNLLNAAFAQPGALDETFEWNNSVTVPLRKWLCQLDQADAEGSAEYLDGQASSFKKGYICAMVVADEPRLTGASAPFPWTVQWAHEIKYRSL